MKVQEMKFETHKNAPGHSNMYYEKYVFFSKLKARNHS